jgi:hypothetical protein
MASILAVVVSIAAYLWAPRSGSPNAPAFGEARQIAPDPSSARLDAGAVESWHSSSEREALPAPGPPTAPSRADAAVLVVRTIDNRTRQPLSKISLRAWKTEDGGGAWLGSNTATSNGDLERPAVTDEEGRAELELPAGIELTLSVGEPTGDCDWKSLELSPLQPGERREMSVELICGNDLGFFGRVLNATESKPMPGVPVRACVYDYDAYDRVQTLSRATTDANGVFELRMPSWRHSFVRVEADGFGVSVLKRLAGHDSPDRALVVLLQSAATLEAEVHDVQGQPVSGVDVRLSVSGRALPPDPETWEVEVPNLKWIGKTSGDGRCSIGGLCPNVGISIELVRGEHVLRREAEPAIFEPGRTLRREWILGAGTTLTGLVLDQDSQPVPKLEIWMSKSGPERSPYFEPDSRFGMSSTTVTDGAGRFELRDVEPGTWWLGPAANGGDSEPHLSARLPEATQVEVLSVPTQDVTLHVHRGLFIRGKVVRPDGLSAPHAYVVAHASSKNWGIYGRTSDDGTFAVGPLPAWRFSLVAEVIGHFASAEPIEAEAGASDVTLRLTTGGALHGRVVDARTGKPCAAEVLLTSRVACQGLFEDGIGFSVEADGIVEQAGLQPGGYDLAARTQDGCFGVLSGLTVVVGEKGKEFVVPVSPGGTLKIRYAGSHRFAGVSLRTQGVQTDWQRNVDAGTSLDLPAPAGTLVLEVRLESEAGSRSRTIHLDPGEVKEIALADSD